MIQLRPQCATCRVKNLSLLRNCPAALLEEISENKTIRSFKPGEQLLKEGGEPDGIYCIRSGVVKAEVHDQRGRALVLRLEGKGAIAGLRAIGQKDRQPLTVTAVEPLQVCHLSAEKFYSISGKYPELEPEIRKTLLFEIHHVEKKALSLVNLSVRERIAEVLLHIAEVYQYRQGRNSLHIHLDRQDMADLAGTTKEQVSTVLAGFHQAGLINIKAKHLKFFDLPGLKEIAGV